MIDKLVLEKDCFGCEACSNICPTLSIHMVQNEHGFFIPKVNYSSCINCSMCKKTCPSINKYNPTPFLCDAYSGRINDDSSLHSSTSGGIFTAVSNYVLEKGGYICGAIFDDDIEVVHIITNEKALRNKMRGAKYVQSRIGDCYKKIKELLMGGFTILFVGTSCQVHALKLFLGKEYNSLITIDIVCHGVPSPLAFKNYVRYLENRYDEIESFRFRSKNLGWRGNNVEISFKNGKTISNCKDTKKYTDLYGAGYLMRQSCFNCPYTSVFRVGDISIGDFWGIENAKSSFDDNRGCSIVLVNTSKGKEIIDKIKNNIKLEIRDVPEILQPNLLSPTKMPNNYDMMIAKIYKPNFWNRN